MTKQYSIAEARDHLPGIVREVENGSPVQITRRGKPVVVMLSLEEYRRLAGPKGGYWEAVEEWRKTVDWDEMGDFADVFENVRDRSPGRDFHW
ncbi:MAG: type II toxin-antitoxin system Phd/YefM family antitoxin [Dehalococcoidia bacterium]